MKIYLIAVIGAILISGCVSQPVRNEMKIGVLAPLSGIYAIQGEFIQNGMEMAREDLAKEHPNLTVTLIYEDVCLAKDSVPAFKKLTEIDNVKIIGGSFCLVGFVPLIPLASDQNVLLFNTAKNPSTILNNSNVFSTNLAIGQDSEFQAKYAIEKLGAKRAAIVYYTTPFGQDFAKFIPKYFEYLGGRMAVSEGVDLGATDFRTELAKIKDAQVDVIYMVHLGNSLGNFLKKARELGINATIISNSEAEDPSVLASAGTAAEGFTISTSESKEKTHAETDFEIRYAEKFGSTPSPMASNAYDSLKLQAMVYAKCAGSIECMKTELHSVKDYNGASGLITISDDGSANKPLSIKIVRNGTFVRVD